MASAGGVAPVVHLARGDEPGLALLKLRRHFLEGLAWHVHTSGVRCTIGTVTSNAIKCKRRQRDAEQRQQHCIRALRAAAVSARRNTDPSTTRDDRRGGTRAIGDKHTTSPSTTTSKSSPFSCRKRNVSQNSFGFLSCSHRWFHAIRSRDDGPGATTTAGVTISSADIGPLGLALTSPHRCRLPEDSIT